MNLPYTINNNKNASLGQHTCTLGWIALWEFLYFFYFWSEEENGTHFYGKLCFSVCSKHRAVFKYEWIILMFQNKWWTYYLWVLKPPSFLTCSFWTRAGLVAVAADRKDPRALAGSVRKVLELINNVCFDISMESGTAEGRKMSNRWKQASTVGRLATSSSRGTAPVLLAPHLLCFSERLYLRDICKPRETVP